MKKSAAAKMWWFRYTAQQRFEYEQRQNQSILKSKNLTYLIAFWNWLQMKYMNLKGKVQNALS